MAKAKTLKGQTTIKALGYDAIQDKQRRKAPATRTISEDKELDPKKRKKLTATLHDTERNFSFLQWMIRFHSKSVARFTFNSAVGDDGFDRDLEGLFNYWSLPRNSDITGRHSFQDQIFLAEMARCLVGDIAALPTKSGALQWIESDRIAFPTTGKIPSRLKEENFTHGIKLNKQGRPLSYLICNREDKKLAYAQQVAAKNVFSLGYYKRFDQVRGISPLVSALNGLRDIYEAKSYALIKAKMLAMFGIAITRPETEIEEEYDDEGAEVTSIPEKKALSSGMIMELADGEDIKTIESNTPSNEFREYMESMGRDCLLALDIPYSMYNSLKSNFSISRQDSIQFTEMIKNKRAQVAALCHKIFMWKFKGWLETGDITLPKKVTLKDVARKVEFRPLGIPYVNPLQEIKADIEAINNQLDSPISVCKRRGKDYFRVVDEIAQAKEYARKKGVLISEVIEKTNTKEK